jgi:HAD superfamily hydrolase (TIGR01509 family)
MIKAILFDFNGVIINDEPLQMKAYQEIFNEQGVELTDEQYFSCTGMDDVTFIKHNFKRADKKISDVQVDELSAKKTIAWRAIIDKNLPIFDGVENFIKKAEKEFALGIVSMAKREEVEYVLTKAGLKECFDVVITSEDTTTCKPNPECYNKGFKLIDNQRIANGHHPTNRNECLVIEDVPQGIEAGKSAGMKVLAVTNTFDADTLRKAGADVVAKNLSDLMPESVKRLF